MRSARQSQNTMDSATGDRPRPLNRLAVAELSCKKAARLFRIQGFRYFDHLEDPLTESFTARDPKRSAPCRESARDIWVHTAIKRQVDDSCRKLTDELYFCEVDVGLDFVLSFLGS